MSVSIPVRRTVAQDVREIKSWMDTAHRGASYEAEELASWSPVIASADAELLHERAALVARSRDICRNDGFASSIVDVHVDNVIGTGLRVSARPDWRLLGRDAQWAASWSREVEARFLDWASDPQRFDSQGRLDFAAASALAYRTICVDGEAFALLSYDVAARDPLTVALIDPDRISNPGGLTIPNRDGLRDGVELDAAGKPIAYHVARRHPLDYRLAAISPQDWTRVEARTSWGDARMIHAFEQQRPGQTRGRPLLTPVLARFRVLEMYQRAEVKAAAVNALIAIFMESALDQESLLALFDNSAQAYLAERQKWTAQLEAGSIISTFPGDKVQGFTPNRPNAQYGDFVEAVMRPIGAAAGLPLELAVRDFTQTNYSSARAALIEARRQFTRRRRLMVTMFCAPIYRAWLTSSIVRGDIAAPGYLQYPAAYARADWTGPGAGWVDPLKEAKAAQARLDAGLSTLDREAAEQGLDADEVLEQRTRERLAQLEAEAVVQREARRLGIAPQGRPPSRDDGE